MAADAAALILVASPADGFDGPLALAAWGSTTLVEHLVAVASGVVEEVCVVLGDGADDVLASTHLGAVTVVIDPEWAEGSAASLRAGLDTLSRRPAIDAAVIVDARYVVDRALLESLLSAHRRSGTLVTVPKYRYTRRGPLVLDRRLWPRIMGMEGDADLLRLIQAHPEWVGEHWVDRLPPRAMRTADDVAGEAPRA
jgi:CTP:molybdopterin cytidylyltransferase MocA